LEVAVVGKWQCDGKRDKRMDGTSLKDTMISKVEVTAVAALQVLLMVMVAVATIVLYVLLVRNLISQVSRIESAAGLLPTMQQSFAGVLTVVLGLELLETLKAYFTEHRVRLEVILVLAIIAVGRQVILLDFEDTTGPLLLGLSGVISALTLGYFLIKKAQAPIASREPVLARVDTISTSESESLAQR
jgi:uncharacterized membrane protein (DUF373 family)